MRLFLKRLFRERRRLVVVAVATFLAGYIAFFDRTSALLGLPFPIVAGLAFMVGLTVSLMVIVVLFPQLRHSAESVALSIPVLSLMGVYGSASDGGLSTTTVIFGILLCYLIFTVYGGAWVDRYLPCRRRILHSFAHSTLQPNEIWSYLTVNPDTRSDYGGPDILSMEWIEPVRSYRQVYRLDELAKIEEVHSIEINEPHRRYRFSFEVPDATESASVSSGSKEFVLTPDDHGTTIETIRDFDKVSARAQLLTWIDDTWGRFDDDNIQCAEAAHRDK
ncbi:MAG: hypothetical protein AAFR21_16530 [Pseudomonadota bacterium]